MINKPSEMSRIKVTKYPSNSWKITLSPNYLFSLNNNHSKEEGYSLFELSNSDHRATYDYLRQAIGLSIFNHAKEITTNNVPVASTETNSSETTRQVAQDIILGCLPASYEGPFEVNLHLFNTKEEKAMGLGESSFVLKLNIKPPNLAF